MVSNDAASNDPLPSDPESIDSGQPPSLRERLAMAALETRLTGSAVQPLVGGRYAIVEIVGRGGMGEVCRAIDRVLQREVAVKFVLTSGAIEPARRRLAAEAKALARVCDPHVVPVFDIVADPLGLCVVMEFVRGVDLRTWLRAGPRSTKQILDVLDAAGRGLAAAHRAGVVHRDVKPDNVMVGDDGRTRVVDFGLARPLRDDSDGGASRHLGAELGSTEPVTQRGTLMGTAGYLAPELYAGRPADARSDQFAYCVMAYEALWGSKPLGPAAIAELARLGADAWRVEPPRDLAKAPAEVVRIVMRGLSGDPDARFPDVDALLAALRGARRRPSRIATATALSATLAITTVFATTNPQPHCGEDPGELAARWSVGHADALRRAFSATALPYAEMAAERVIDHVTARFDTLTTAHAAACTSDSEPSVRDAVLACIHDQYGDLEVRVAMYLAADRDLVTRAAESTASLPDPRDCTDDARVGGRELLTEPQRQLRRDLDRGFALADAGNLGDARNLAIDVRATLRDAGDAAGANDATRLLGEIMSDLGDYAGAQSALDDAYFESMSRGDAPRAFSAAADLVSLHAHRQVRLDDAQLWLRHLRALAQQSSSPEREARLAAAEAGVMLATGRYAAAIITYRVAIQRFEALDGASSPRLIWARQDLGLTYARSGDHARADQTFVDVLVAAQATWGTDHPEYASMLENHANVLDELGRRDEALASHARVLEIRRRSLGENHPDVASSLTNLGNQYEALGDLGQARDFHQRALAVRRRGPWGLHPANAATLNNLGNVLSELGQIEAAQAAYDEALEISERVFGPEDPSVALLLSNLGTFHEARGAHAQARSMLLRSLAIRERVFGAHSPQTAYSLHNLGVVELHSDSYDQAIVWLERALSIREHASDPYLLATTRQSLAEALRARDGESERMRSLSTLARATFEALHRAQETADVDAWEGRADAPTAEHGRSR